MCHTRRGPYANALGRRACSRRSTLRINFELRLKRPNQSKRKMSLNPVKKLWKRSATLPLYHSGFGVSSLSFEFGVCLRSLECSKTMVLKYENGGFASRKGWGSWFPPSDFLELKTLDFEISRSPRIGGRPEAKPKTWDLETPTSKLQIPAPHANKF